MNDKTLGEYKRTTPDPDETTGEALARLQAKLTRLLDEADAELRDEADGGVAAALIEKEVEQHDAAESRPLTPDAITLEEQYEEGLRQAGRGKADHLDPLTVWLMGAEWAGKRLAPARPEGAEEIDEHLRQANAAALGGALTLEQRRALADHLAGFGYRNPIALTEDGAA